MSDMTAEPWVWLPADEPYPDRFPDDDETEEVSA